MRSMEKKEIPGSRRRPDIGVAIIVAGVADVAGVAVDRRRTKRCRQ